MIHTKPPEEKEHQREVRRVFHAERTWKGRFLEAFGKLRAHTPLFVGSIALSVVAVFLAGFAVGGGSPDPAVVSPSSDFFITADQAQEFRQQSSELRQAQSSLAITEGEAAFLRSQVVDLTSELETSQLRANERELQLTLVVGVYEECMQRLYPAECVASGLARADVVLDDLYPAGS